MYKKWYDSDLKVLKRLCIKGVTYRNISIKLNRTIASVEAKTHRIGFIKIKKVFNLTEKAKRKISEANTGTKNGMWKGDKVSYKCLHAWVKRHKHMPDRCPECKKKVKLDICNISGKYKRDLRDWKYLCRRCHMKDDNRLETWNDKRNRNVKNGLVKRDSYGRFV